MVKPLDSVRGWSLDEEAVYETEEMMIQRVSVAPSSVVVHDGEQKIAFSAEQLEKAMEKGSAAFHRSSVHIEIENGAAVLENANGERVVFEDPEAVLDALAEN